MVSADTRYATTANSDAKLVTAANADAKYETRESVTSILSIAANDAHYVTRSAL